MLKEKNYYKEDLPVNVITANIEEYPIHFHDDFEVIYVLEGNVKLKNGYYTYTLKQGDIFILNAREIHSFYHTGHPNMVMMLQLNLTYFSKYYENLTNSFFITDMKDSDDETLEGLRCILARIMLDSLEMSNGYEHKIIENAHNLIANLHANFQYFNMEDGKFINETKNKGNKILAGRLNRITEYMYENYTRRLTLNEIAELEHLSIYYLSHIIKESSGLSFQELLSFIRVEESEKLLLGTNKKIGAISEESGFSAVRYYIKYFIKWFGIHPAEYREKYTGKVSSREISARYTLSEPEEILKSIKHQVDNVFDLFCRGKGTTLTIVKLDLDEPLKTMKNMEIELKTLLKQDCMRPASNALKMLIDLNENIIASANNYIITKSHRTSLQKEGFSILLYNNNEKLKAIAEEGQSLAFMMEALSKYDEDAEVLINISGMNGDYKVSRYKYSKENILMSYAEKIGNPHTISKRTKMEIRWACNPTAEYSTISAIDTLSLQSNLYGFSAELILIDRI